MNPEFIELGMRVRVYDGEYKQLLGEGTLVGLVTVYAVYDSNRGVLVSEAEAEVPQEGSRKIVGSPKIVLDDDSKVVYGCQVWWEPISPEQGAS